MEGSGIIFSGGGGFDLNALLELTRNNAITSSNLIEKINEHSQQMNEVETKVSKVENKVSDLVSRMDLREKNETLSSNQRKTVLREISNRVYKILGIKKYKGKTAPESKNESNVYRSLFYSRLHYALRERFNVAEYSDIRAIDFNDAIAFIRSWQPDDGIDSLKREAEENWESNHPGMSVNEYLGRLSI